jgi:hypothetical protein
MFKRLRAKLRWWRGFIPQSPVAIDFYSAGVRESYIEIRRLSRIKWDHEEALLMNLEFDRKKLAEVEGITMPLHEGVL